MIDNDNNNIYKLGEFAKLINVHEKTLQRLDRQGVLVAYRTITNRRYYTDEHIKLYYAIRDKIKWMNI